VSPATTANHRDNGEGSTTMDALRPHPSPTTGLEPKYDEKYTTEQAKEEEEEEEEEEKEDEEEGEGEGEREDQEQE